MSQKNSISIIPGQFPQVFYISQNDVGRDLIVKLADETGDYQVPTGATAKLVGTKPSGLGFTLNGTVDGTDKSKVTFTTTAEASDEFGHIPVEVKIQQGTTVLGSANLYLDVERNPHPDWTHDGIAADLVNQLTLILNQIEEDIEKAEVLSESEAWAVGKRDGVPVTQDDDTYHNNSKWYADQSKASSTNAANSETAAAGHENTAKGYKEAAAASATAAENAAAAAAAVFTVAGDMSASIDADGDLWLNITVN